MAYRCGNRYQAFLFPPTIDEYIPKSHPVRVFDAIIEKIDLRLLGITEDPNRVGNSSYHPKTMLKLLVYCYSYGIRSSRKLEQACYENLSVKWLMEGLTPDHKTIAELRRRNKEALKKIMSQTSKMMLSLGLIEGSVLFVDGSKIRANASKDRFKSTKEYKEIIERVERNIDKVLEEAEAMDESEEGLPSLIKVEGIETEYKDIDELVEEAQNKVEELEREVINTTNFDKDMDDILKKSQNKEDELKREFINTTDPDCIKIISRQWVHAGYNVQIVVDGKNGMIMSSDVVNEHNDLHQFTEQIKKAEAIIGKKCEIACADSGYFFVKILKEAVEGGRRVIMPSPKQVNNKGVGEFSKDKFIYDAEEDCYICPEGNKLVYSYYNKEKRQYIYRFTSSKICKSCKHYGVCTTAKRGRTIERLEEEDIMKKLEMEYLDSSSQKIYRKRKGKVEHPFGHIKHNLGVSSFLLRGLEGVRAEMSILATCFNIMRAITIIGVSRLIEMITNM